MQNIVQDHQPDIHSARTERPVRTAGLKRISGNAAKLSLPVSGGRVQAAPVIGFPEQMPAGPEVKRERLLQAQKLEIVGRLAPGVAHDLNNLLTAIQGFTDMILQSPGRPDDVVECAQEIRQAAVQASALSRQLLAIGRPQSECAVPVVLNDLVGELYKMLKGVLGPAVRLTLDLSPISSTVLAGPGRLEQVVMNLAINARDAMPAGGDLRIRTGQLLVYKAGNEARPGVPAGKYASLTMTDTGCGMTPEVKTRIFQPFFTTKGPGKGTGIGLASVSHIVKQANGHMVVSSEPGCGSVFEILLPLTPSL